MPEYKTPDWAIREKLALEWTRPRQRVSTTVPNVETTGLRNHLGGNRRRTSADRSAPCLGGGRVCTGPVVQRLEFEQLVRCVRGILSIFRRRDHEVWNQALALTGRPLTELIPCRLRELCREKAIHLGARTDAHLSYVMGQAPFDGIVLRTKAVSWKRRRG